MSRSSQENIPATIHQAILGEYERTGAVPPSAVLAEMTDLDQGLVRRALRALLNQGVLAQPHGERAPYVPLRRLDGSPVKPTLLDDEMSWRVHYARSLTPEDRARMGQVTEVDVRAKLRAHIDRLKAEATEPS